MRSPRIVLNTISERDREQLVKLYTTPSLRRFLGGALTEETATCRVDALLRTLPRLNWAIRDEVGGIFLGTVSLDDHHDGEDIEVSFALLPFAQGHGFATAAVRAALHEAFTTLKLSRVIAETQSANEKSIALLRRVGMRPLKKIVRFDAEQTIFSMNENTFFHG